MGERRFTIATSTFLKIPCCSVKYRTHDHLGERDIYFVFCDVIVLVEE